MANKKPASFWLRTPVWDGFWILSGVWLPIPLIALSSADQVLQVVLICSVFLLWLPHRFATVYNAFCTPAYRELVFLKKKRFLALPALIFASTYLFVFAPRTVLPLDSFTRIQVLATVFFLYNSYHFAMQHYGVLSIYRIRAEQPHSGWLKRYERIYCVSVGMVIVAFAQICHGAEVVQDSILYEIVPGKSLQPALGVLRVLMPILVVGFTLVMLLGELKSKRRSPSKVIYVLGVGFQGVLAYFLSPLSFLILWGVQHWLVSVALAGHMAENDPSESPAHSRWYGFWNRFNRGFWPTVFGLCVLTVILAPFFEYTLHYEKIKTAPRFLSWVGDLVENSLVFNFFIALNFASVYVHFAMDRAVFRFSDPEIRRVTGPLLFANKILPNSSST